MDGDVAAAVVWIVVVLAAIAAFVRLASGGGSSHTRPGAGSVGTVYDWLNETSERPSN